MPRVTLTIDEEILAEVRELAGPRQLSAYVTEALCQQLARDHQRERLREMLAEMDVEAGPVPDDVMEEARRLWSDAEVPAKNQRQSA